MNQDGKQTGLNQELSTEVIGGSGSSNALVSADEYIKLYQVAVHLHQSGLYKSAGNEAGVFAIILLGKERGIPPMTALQNIQIIDGKPSYSSALLLGLAKKEGIPYEVLLRTIKGARIKFTGTDGMEFIGEFHEEDAKRAGLLSKTNWTKYPADMYFWRAVSIGLKVVAPDIFSGVYTPDELSGGDYNNIEGAAVGELNKAKKAAENRKHGFDPNYSPATTVQLQTIELQKEEKWVPPEVKLFIDGWLKEDLKSRDKADKIIKRLVECRETYEKKENSESSKEETDGEGSPSPNKNQEVKGSPETSEPGETVDPESVSVTEPEIPKNKEVKAQDLPDNEYMLLSREALKLRNEIEREFKNVLYPKIDITFRTEVESFLNNKPIPLGVENVKRHVALSLTYIEGIRNLIKKAGNAPEKQAESSRAKSDELLADLSNYAGEDKDTLHLQHHIASIRKELEYRDLGSVLKAEVETFLKRDFRKIAQGDLQGEVKAALSLYRDCNLKNVRKDVNTNDLFSNSVQTPKQKELTTKALIYGDIIKYENFLYKKNQVGKMERDNERSLFLGTLDLNKADDSKLSTYKKNLARKRAEKEDF